VEVITRHQAEASQADPMAFAAWVRPHLVAMARLAARLGPDADRDDIVQEALVRAWRRWTTFDPGRGSAQAWLLAIVADQGRRHRLRRLGRARVQIDRAEHGALDADRDIDLESALQKLPPRERLAVDLYYFVGADVATTAAAMQCAPGTVKATLHHARERLRKLLEEQP
jgi:RNA polymerase sigma-70 factor (ECF subfamily)